MSRRNVLVCLIAAFICGLLMAESAKAQGPYAGYPQAQRNYGLEWGQTYRAYDWNRYYHYPYVYYPQNFWSGSYYQSSGSMYYRYPPEMQIPVYNRSWQNYYPQTRRYHQGHHFILDIF